VTAQCVNIDFFGKTVKVRRGSSESNLTGYVNYEGDTRIKSMKLTHETNRPIRLAGWLLALIVTVGPGATSARAQLGLVLSGAGAVNRSMGGASTAAPIDAGGALFWNPATIGALTRSEMSFNTEILIPRTSITSKIPAGVLGPNAISGTTGGNNGIFPLPTFALVQKASEDSPITYGFGFFTLGGFGVNYPASTTNPVLTPQFPYGRGAGTLYSQYLAYQIAPTVSYKVTDSFWLGFSGNFDLAQLSLNPALFSSPTAVSTPGGTGGVYPYATNGHVRFGGGFQVGAYYDDGGDWRYGASIRSPQWFESYTYNSVTALGKPTTPKFDLDFPMIASVGTSYVGIEKTLVALDVRFVDYHNTNGFRHTGFDPTGALRGLGWQSIFAVALGTQYTLSDSLSLRAGYTFSMNPIGNDVTSFNIASPTNIMNSLACGFSYSVNKNLTLSLAYAHDFQNSNTGPIIQPSVGAIPGSSVRAATTADSVVIGASVYY
jgi:long-chain fatty acid transport protein